MPLNGQYQLPCDVRRSFIHSVEQMSTRSVVALHSEATDAVAHQDHDSRQDDRLERDNAGAGRSTFLRRDVHVGAGEPPRRARTRTGHDVLIRRGVQAW